MFLAVASLAGQQPPYLSPDPAVKFQIKGVTVPTNLSQPLQVTFEMAATGKTPIAVSQDHFAFVMWRPGNFSEESGDLLFSNTVPNILIAQSMSNITITATIASNDFHQSWSHSGPGQYGMQIAIGSDKTRHFDYEYMGQRRSDPYLFAVHADTTNNSPPLRRD